jgi:hypothetical protein
MAQRNYLNSRPVIGLLLFIVMCQKSGEAQEQQFELVAPHLRVASTASLTPRQLVVTNSQGVATHYERQPRLDSPDGLWLAYASSTANQVVRWPMSGAGNMQIGEVHAGTVSYRQSQMVIQPIAGVPARIVERPALPPLTASQPGEILPPEQLAPPVDPAAESQASQYFQELATRGDRMLDAELLWLATQDGRGGQSWLQSNEAELSVDRNQPSGWWIAPTSGGFARLQTSRQGRVFAISSRADGTVAMQPLAQDARQLWRVIGDGRLSGGFMLENGFHPGTCLTRTPAGGLVIQAIRFLPQQTWFPFTTVSLAVAQPFWRSSQRELHVNAPLPPAQLELINSHRQALLVLLADRRPGHAVQEIRLEPNSSQTVALDRDSGATLVETYEIRNPIGTWESRQLVTAVPSAAYYDLSVYEEHLQSIAIDATGKSPNPIEDINYVPKSVGWLPLPAGTELPARGELDVYPLAKSANNPGAVLRLDPHRLDVGTAASQDPLENILDRIQSVPRRKF